MTINFKYKDLKCTEMNNEYLLAIEGRLHGYHTRLKELHFSAPTMSLHKVIDDFDSALQEFDDTIMEDAQSIFGFIEPGMINPVLPEETEIEALLRSIRAMLADMKDNLQEKLYTGIINTVDDFRSELNKTIYLVMICKKEC